MLVVIGSLIPEWSADSAVGNSRVREYRTTLHEKAAASKATGGASNEIDVGQVERAVHYEKLRASFRVESCAVLAEEGEVQVLSNKEGRSIQGDAFTYQLRCDEDGSLHAEQCVQIFGTTHLQERGRWWRERWWRWRWQRRRR